MAATAETDDKVRELLRGTVSLFACGSPSLAP
jgi:hypothetical protein